MVTPIRPVELMIGKMLPFAVVGFVDMAIVTLGALLVFHVPFRGSWGMLVASAALFLLNHSGRGSPYFHDFANSAAGNHVGVHVRHADIYAQRLRIPDPEHA